MHQQTHHCKGIYLIMIIISQQLDQFIPYLIPMHCYQDNIAGDNNSASSKPIEEEINSQQLKQQYHQSDISHPTQSCKNVSSETYACQKNYEMKQIQGTIQLQRIARLLYSQNQKTINVVSGIIDGTQSKTIQAEQYYQLNLSQQSRTFSNNHERKTSTLTTIEIQSDAILKQARAIKGKQFLYCHIQPLRNSQVYLLQSIIKCSLPPKWKDQKLQEILRYSLAFFPFINEQISVSTVAIDYLSKNDGNISEQKLHNLLQILKPRLNLIMKFTSSYSLKQIITQFINIYVRDRFEVMLEIDQEQPTNRHNPSLIKQKPISNQTQRNISTEQLEKQIIQQQTGEQPTSKKQQQNSENHTDSPQNKQLVPFNPQPQQSQANQQQLSLSKDGDQYSENSSLCLSYDGKLNEELSFIGILISIKETNLTVSTSTAFLINPYTLLTCIHSFENQNQEFVTTEIIFIPGCINTFQEFRYRSKIEKKDVHTTNTRKDFSQLKCGRELAIIYLKDPIKVAKTIPSCILYTKATTKELEIIGYPQSKVMYDYQKKTLTEILVQRRQLKGHSVNYKQDEHKIEHDLSTQIGMSGSPILTVYQNGRVGIIGIHTHGSPKAGGNRLGLLFTKPIIQIIEEIVLKNPYMKRQDSESSRSFYQKEDGYNDSEQIEAY